jgi:hypothetical protein
MNSASLERSKRLQRVAKLLSDGQEHSTLDIFTKANVCAVNSIISELRDNGMNILPAVRRGGVFYYRAKKAPI